MASRVAVLGRKCNDQRLRKLRVLFEDLSNPEASFKDYSVTPPEAETIMRYVINWSKRLETPL